MDGPPGCALVNGDHRDDRQENSRVGASLGWSFNASNSLTFCASCGVTTRIGNDFDTIGVLYQYRW